MFTLEQWAQYKAEVDERNSLAWEKCNATKHAEIGTPITVIEAILDHKSGTISGVSAIYIRHNFSKEATYAQVAFENYLQSGILK